MGQCCGSTKQTPEIKKLLERLQKLSNEGLGTFENSFKKPQDIKNKKGQLTKTQEDIYVVQGDEIYSPNYLEIREHFKVQKGSINKQGIVSLMSTHQVEYQPEYLDPLQVGVCSTPFDPFIYVKEIDYDLIYQRIEHSLQQTSIVLHKAIYNYLTNNKKLAGRNNPYMKDTAIFGNNDISRADYTHERGIAQAIYDVKCFFNGSPLSEQDYNQQYPEDIWSGIEKELMILRNAQLESWRKLYGEETRGGVGMVLRREGDGSLGYQADKGFGDQTGGLNEPGDGQGGADDQVYMEPSEDAMMVQPSSVKQSQSLKDAEMVGSKTGGKAYMNDLKSDDGGGSFKLGVGEGQNDGYGELGEQKGDNNQIQMTGEVNATNRNLLEDENGGGGQEGGETQNGAQQEQGNPQDQTNNNQGGNGGMMQPNTVTPPQDLKMELRQGEDYGWPYPPVQLPEPGPLFFKSNPQANSKRKTVFSSSDTPVHDSLWLAFHERIKGEFKDFKFDFSFLSNDEPDAGRALFGLERNLESHQKLTWINYYKAKRLSREFPNLKVEVNGFSPDDIYQGSLGDYYLLSVISALCEQPQRIKRLFSQRSRSPKGAYCVSLCTVGQFKDFYLDDIVLCRRIGNGNRPSNNKTTTIDLAFAQNNELEMWVLLLEKAYAKAHGGYYNIAQGGFGHHAFFDLTGAPSECITFKPKQPRMGELHHMRVQHHGQRTFFEEIRQSEISLLFDKLYDYEQQGFTMNCCSRSLTIKEEREYQKRLAIANKNKSNKQIEQERDSNQKSFGNGLLADHAYTLLGAKRLDNGTMLIKLKNPWGTTEYFGSYSDENIDPAILNQLGSYSLKQDGMFHIPVEVFANYFESINVCHFKNDFITSSISDVNTNSGFACFQFYVHEEDIHYFGVSQPDPNMLPQGHRLAYLSVVLIKCHGNGAFEVVGGKAQNDRDIWFRIHCTRGKYIAYVSTLWSDDNINVIPKGHPHSNSFSFWSYARKAIEFERVTDQTSLQECQEVFSKGMIEYASRHPDLKYYDGTEEDGFWKHARTLNVLTDFGYRIHYESFDKKGDKKFKVTHNVGLQKFEGLRIIWPESVAGTGRGEMYEISLKPGEERVVIAQRFSERVAYTLTKNSTATYVGKL